MLLSLQDTLSAPVGAILLFSMRHNRVLNKEVHNNVTCFTVTFRTHTQVQGVFSSPSRVTGARLLLDILSIHLNTTGLFFPSVVLAVRLLPVSASHKYSSKWIYQSFISVSFCISISKPWMIYCLSMTKLLLICEMITDYQADSVYTTVSLISVSFNFLSAAVTPVLPFLSVRNTYSRFSLWSHQILSPSNAEVRKGVNLHKLPPPPPIHLLSWNAQEFYSESKLLILRFAIPFV